jgi:hypothetical protein
MEASIKHITPKSTPAFPLFYSEYFGRLQTSTRKNRERIWNPEVRVHGLIATVWTPYDFWTDGKFSHCGVDAFDLIKTAEGWKIFRRGLQHRSEVRAEPARPAQTIGRARNRPAPNHLETYNHARTNSWLTRPLGPAAPEVDG